MSTCDHISIDNHTLVLNKLHNDDFPVYCDKALIMYDILLSIPEGQSSVDLSDFTDKFVSSARFAWDYDYNFHHDSQEGDIGAGEFVDYNIDNMLLVRQLFPKITNIIASNTFHKYVNDHWWCRNKQEQIYKIFNK